MPAAGSLGGRFPDRYQNVHFGALNHIVMQKLVKFDGFYGANFAPWRDINVTPGAAPIPLRGRSANLSALTLLSTFRWGNRVAELDCCE